MCVVYVCRCPKGPKVSKALLYNHLCPKLQAVVSHLAWVLGIELLSPGKTVQTLHQESFSNIPTLFPSRFSTSYVLSAGQSLNRSILCHCQVSQAQCLFFLALASGELRQNTYSLDHICHLHI